MKYDQLSDEVKEVLKSMVGFCINHGYKMGMDEGFIDYDKKKKHEFRKQLEAFSKNYN